MQLIAQHLLDDQSRRTDTPLTRAARAHDLPHEPARFLGCLADLAARSRCRPGVGAPRLGAHRGAGAWPLQETFDLWLLFKLARRQFPTDDVVLVTIASSHRTDHMPQRPRAPGPLRESQSRRRARLS